jgi:ribosome-associated protein
MSSEKNESSSSASLSEGADPSREKALACARAAIDKKAENVKVLDLTELSGFTDYFVICSGMSDRQVQAIAESVEFEMEAAGHELVSIEGYAEGRWVLMDLGDVVVHIFLDALREYYDLENLWVDAPRVKIPSEFYGQAGSRIN